MKAVLMRSSTELVTSFPENKQKAVDEYVRVTYRRVCRTQRINLAKDATASRNYRMSFTGYRNKCETADNRRVGQAYGDGWSEGDQCYGI